MANVLTQTTLSANLGVSATVLNVASATGISAPSNNFVQRLYIIDQNKTRGELVNVNSVNGTAIQVSRLDKYKTSHKSGAIVLIAPIDPTLGGFYEYDPNGAPSTDPLTFQPWVNIDNGHQWLYSSLAGMWVAGFNNPEPNKGPTAAVASAAGAILPSGPLFHVTGALAVTGFTIPVGFAGGSFVVIPDGAFTWTTAGNIAVAGTAVVNRALTFTWDSSVSKFNPSYV